MRLPSRFAAPLLALTLFACVGKASLDSNFRVVRLADAVVLAAGDGKPYSGRLVARDAEVAQLAGHLFAGSNYAALAEADTQGLILELTLTDGQAHGPVQLYADTSSKAWDEALEGRLGALSAAAIEALGVEVKIGEAHFDAGVLHGAATIYMPSPDAPFAPTLYAEAMFTDGQPHGVVRQYFPGSASAQARELSFAQGTRVGPQRSYYPNGQLERELDFVDGHPEGLGREFYASGAPRAERSYAGGEPSEAFTRWYPDGQLAVRVEAGPEGLRRTEWYSNGELRLRQGPEGVEEHAPEGEISEYYPSGAVRIRGHFRAGERHGQVEVFYSDGGQWETASFEQGLQIGEHRKWWKNGQLALEANFIGGQLAGELRRWYANGQAWEQATYVDGKLDGDYEKWWKNGQLAHDYRYVDGELDGPYRTFYDNGAKWAVGEYLAGKPQGILHRWFPDGRLGFVQHHEGGRPHGAHQRWWADGTLRLDAHYEHGRLHGKFENWLEDGTLYVQTTYERGLEVQLTANNSPPAQSPG